MKNLRDKAADIDSLTLEQLIIGAQNNAIGDYSSGYDGTPLDTDYKDELLRRFRELEKKCEDVINNAIHLLGCTFCDKHFEENKAIDFYTFGRIAHRCPVCDKEEIAALQKQVEDMACCGNCDKYQANCYVQFGYEYCDGWQSDGLTRAERLKG